MSGVIEKVKTNIYRQVCCDKFIYEGIPFDKYQKFYFCTNENIKDYLNDIRGKQSALSVLGSGDHLFNLIEKGIKNVDTFDTNLLTRYYVFGIRHAMILKFNYYEYLETVKKFINNDTSLEELTNILYELLPYMSRRYRNFWKEIMDYNYTLQKSRNTNLNLFSLISLGEDDINKVIKNNNYLINESNYNNLKDNLKNVKITFKNINAIHLSKKYSNLYDLILLSNIPQYLGHYFYKYDIEDYITDLRNMLTTEGIVYFNYIHKYRTDNFIRKKIFVYLNEEGHNLINNEIKTVEADNNVKDGVIILRKK